MNKLFFSLSALFLITALNCSESSDPDIGGFITKLGNDTLVVEKFEKEPDSSRITARVIRRIPELTLTEYLLETDETGGISKLTASEFKPDEGFGEEEGKLYMEILRDGDSLTVHNIDEQDTTSYSVQYYEGILPFIDMVHWPFELALNRAIESGSDTLNQAMLSGRRVSNFVIAAIEGDSMTIRHPSRGVMGVQVNEDGNLDYLDASQTTRKLKVVRDENAALNLIAEDFIGSQPLGQLSGAKTGEFAIGEAHIKIEYGSPKKRGRTLFGGIVPYGERWRTGANRATHFYTSENLVIEGLSVPSGAYTLFTIPEEDGGTLIINKQIGQNGQSYNQSRDLGRVPMSVQSYESTAEEFTIRAEETESGGQLQLIWGNTMYYVNFEIE